MAQLCGSSGSAGLNLAMRGLSLSPYSYCRSFRAARSALIQSQRTITTSKGQKDVISQGVTPRIPTFEKPILPPLSEEQKKVPFSFCVMYALNLNWINSFSNGSGCSSPEWNLAQDYSLSTNDHTFIIAALQLHGLTYSRNLPPVTLGYIFIEAVVKLCQTHDSLSVLELTLALGLWVNDSF